MLYSPDDQTAGTVTVLWGPEHEDAVEPYCRCDGLELDERQILAEIGAAAPAGTRVWIERQTPECWRVHIREAGLSEGRSQAGSQVATAAS